MSEPTTRRPQSRGACAFCRRELAKSGMRRHLETCEARAQQQAANKRSSTPGKTLHITVEGAYDGAYWLHLETAPGVTLADLDSYLRDIWLECCGHLSSFEVGDTAYSSSPDEWMGDESMSARLSRVLPPGSSCLHHYDFGSTTTLAVRVWGEVAQRTGTAKIILLARNLEPVYRCSTCRATPAVQICTNCQWENGGFLCEQCAAKHECGEEMQLPVVNSPRTGVCGYTG